ncbi:MAG: glycine dehydrogenase (aminomethyl-transferring) [Neisseriaceae bacterium]|nr:MAG: glycine dehydrogenase (aminomethyl-transferring) [Neisseriaceae bacterium]
MNEFCKRHIGLSQQQQVAMLNDLGCNSLDQFIGQVIPSDLISQTKTTQKIGLSEDQALAEIKAILDANTVYKNYIGLGYYDTITPAVIRRNVFENPGWYTAYTPYQAEVSQGRLEALLNYQQMLIDLTGFDLANASLLDEATAAAEAMAMAKRVNPNAGNKFFVDQNIFPQTLSVMQTRAQYLEIELVVTDISQVDATQGFGCFIQNPDLYGTTNDFTSQISEWKQQAPKLIVVMACDIMSLVLFKSPATQGADIAIGSTQRFGIPIGFGGPSAAYMATKDAYKRLMPGRIIGVSVDSRGKKALRMALQTREQHIRREKATSNICTAQVLLANMAGFYATYHGADGLKAIAKRITYLANLLAHNLRHYGVKVFNQDCLFDTLSFEHADAAALMTKLNDNGYAIGSHEGKLFISVGESASLPEIEDLVRLICNDQELIVIEPEVLLTQQLSLYRQDTILAHEVFSSYHSETKMMRYLKYLENKDISLVHSMIPLGSCTMKLNAAAELEPLSWPQMANIHPFAPRESVQGYITLINSLKQQLKDITGFDDVCMQPNSGAQGEYTGLLAIRRYQASLGQAGRDVCLIPRSAHGTNPATAQMMGMEVVVVNCDDSGNVEVADMRAKAEQYRERLSCLMITYPSTHGVFEASIKEICQIIHDNGGQVYMDGANLNALVGLVKSAELGADVSHMNLHKTFAIPHGGGGPGMGPIGVKQHLVDFLPLNPIFDAAFDVTRSAVSSAPFGSASILAISWMYITMLGEYGLEQSTKAAILNANYVAHHLAKIGYPILYTGQNQRVAHECIIDLRPLKAESGITEVDFAKRLMDYGFHAPTMSFPVPGTLMIEPTESESKEELDRFIQAMASIYAEVQQVLNGGFDKLNNPLKNAPHTLADLMTWDKPYSQKVACFPMSNLEQSKVFPSVNRIDDAHGDRNFTCSCFDLN